MKVFSVKNEVLQNPFNNTPLIREPSNEATGKPATPWTVAGCILASLEIMPARNPTDVREKMAIVDLARDQQLNPDLLFPADVWKDVKESVLNCPAFLEKGIIFGGLYRLIDQAQMMEMEEMPTFEKYTPPAKEEKSAEPQKENTVV